MNLTARWVALILMLVPACVHAELKLPAIIGSQMVLQRDAQAPVWGWANPGEKITVKIPQRNQSHETLADAQGKWMVRLDPLKVGDPLTVVIQGEKKTLELTDVLVGEVWVCSGQSNMQWAVQSARDPDLEKLSAKYPNIRLIQVRTQGTQKPLSTFEDSWKPCTPETVGGFSAVGYFYGRQLHETLDVPIGLIDNAWGGSACEAWIDRELLKDKELYEPLLARWRKTEETFDWETLQANYQKRLEKYREAAAAARKAGKPLPPRPRAPRNQLTGQHRPGNLFNARLMPIVPYGIRGAIWYQGETNASRAYQYRDMFPLMISNWRDVWDQGDFPFYFVQLADFRDEKDAPADSDWAELREAQTMTLDRLPNTGQAVIIDLGEGKDIHPRNKQDVAKRLARLALARDYGYDIAHQSPRAKETTFAEGKATVTFDHVEAGLRTFDTRRVKGFELAGPDHKFYPAEAKIVGKNQVVLTSPKVKQAAAVRYAWADNPDCNLFDSAGLPVTPFRTDDQPGVTAEAR